MTTDTVEYSIEFESTVPENMGQRISSHAEEDIIEVTNITVGNNTLTFTVKGDSNAIPVFEEQFRESELANYPSSNISCTITNK